MSRMPGWINDVASVVTILGLPVTLASLSQIFEVGQFAIQLPKVPGVSAFLLLIYFLLSLAFAKAFSAWFAHCDLKLSWSRLFTIPVFGFLSVAQTFVAIEMLFGTFGSELSAGYFAILMVIAVGLEQHFLLLRQLDNPTVAVLGKTFAIIVFGMMLATEADTLERYNLNNMFPFGMIFMVGSFVLAALLIGIHDRSASDDGGNQETQK